MSYISRFDTKFLTLMNRKYKEYNVNFEFFDDYILWLYYDYYKKDIEKYYKQLEKDLWEYVDFQSGKERDKRDRLTVNEEYAKGNNRK